MLLDNFKLGLINRIKSAYKKCAFGTRIRPPPRRERRWYFGFLILSGLET